MNSVAAAIEAVILRLIERNYQMSSSFLLTVHSHLLLPPHDKFTLTHCIAATVFLTHSLPKQVRFGPSQRPPWLRCFFMRGRCWLLEVVS